MRHRWLILGLAAALVVGVAPTALADHVDFSRTETVLAGVPVRAENPCQGSSPTHGVLGQVYQLPTGAGDGAHTFRVANEHTLDTDPFFWDVKDDGSCEDLGSCGANLGFFGQDEWGTICEGADYVEVDYFAGNGVYTLSIPDPAQLS